MALVRMRDDAKILERIDECPDREIRPHLGKLGTNFAI
jgi:hypothetical protein